MPGNRAAVDNVGQITGYDNRYGTMPFLGASHLIPDSSYRLSAYIGIRRARNNNAAMRRSITYNNDWSRQNDANVKKYVVIILTVKARWLYE